MPVCTPVGVVLAVLDSKSADVVCETSDIEEELCAAGAIAEIAELNSDRKGSATLLGSAEKRIESAFVVVGVGEALTA